MTLVVNKSTFGQECTTLIADSAVEFSGTQGQNGWHYGYYDGDSASPFTPSDFEEFPLFIADRWQRTSVICGFEAYCTYVAATSAHPNGTIEPAGGIIREINWSVYRWISDIVGVVEVTLDVLDLDVGGSENGVRIHLFVDGVEQSNFVVGIGGSAINTVLASVSIGTVVDVALDPNGGNDYFDLTQLLVGVRKCGYPSPAAVVRVVYQTESIVNGPLSFGLPVLPESLTATIVLSNIDATENITAGLGDVASFSIGFGDGQWTDLTSFSLVTNGVGEVTTLSYATTEIDTPSVFDGGILNSSFSATIAGTDIASGQDFEYNYASSEQTLVLEPATSAIPTTSQWGLVVMSLLMLTAGTVVHARRAKPVVR